MDRKAIGKKLRFEVLKRDGFRCRYCGATPNVCILHIDHVIPVAKGGSNHPANLVAACASCNGGKSDRLLKTVAIQDGPSQKEMAEQAEQLRGYLECMQQLESAREQVFVAMAELWESRIGPLSQTMANRLQSMLDLSPAELVRNAIEAVGRSKVADPFADFIPSNALRQQKYFYGVLRQVRASGDSGAV